MRIARYIKLSCEELSVILRIAQFVGTIDALTVLREKRDSEDVPRQLPGASSTLQGSHTQT